MDAVEPDHVDLVLEQWRRVRPDVDVSGMAAIGRLSRVTRAVERKLETVFARHDLRSWEFDVLATLRRQGEPFRLTAGELVEATMVTSGSMTNRIDRLEKRGLATRRSDPEDGRRVLVELTSTGRRAIDAALPDHAANEREILSVLDKSDEEELIRLLRLLQDDPAGE